MRRQKNKMKKLILILAMILTGVSAFTEELFAIKEHKETVCGSFFEYQTVSFSDEKYKAFENPINEYVKSRIQSGRIFLQENEADFPQLKKGTAVESWVLVKSSGKYFNAIIVYWYYFGPSPWYLSKSFTFDTHKNALVNLAQITGLSGRQIFDEILRQLHENNEMNERDYSRLEDFLDERDFYEQELENQAFVFTDDGRIRLEFDKADFLGKPDFEFYFDVKKWFFWTDKKKIRSPAGQQSPE